MNRHFEDAYKSAFGHFPSPAGEPEIEKFARLIVEECKMVCGAVQGAYELRGNQDFADGAAQARAVIEKHFKDKL